MHCRAEKKLVHLKVIGNCGDKARRAKRRIGSWMNVLEIKERVSEWCMAQWNDNEGKIHHTQTKE